MTAVTTGSATSSIWRDLATRRAQLRRGRGEGGADPTEAFLDSVTDPLDTGA
ncbi:hypothetical protein [Kineococcus arenarius]|uniref:hypothetical protein n=1 Tax=Kineococcus sp. SYSU DK007 TaxID=3383128 RepID=UPI003D7DF7F2